MGTKKITIEIDDRSGKVVSTDIEGVTVRTIPMEDVTLAVESGGAVVHHKIVYVPQNTVIHTRSNPTCRWVFLDGQRVPVCT